jgi:hypothetical protein
MLRRRGIAAIPNITRSPGPCARDVLCDISNAHKGLDYVCRVLHLELPVNEGSA